MGSDAFEIGVYESGRMLLRTMDPHTLLLSMRWLSRQNANGANIYIRPHGEHNLSMVDDLTGDAIAAMKTTGFGPAAVVETSPGNYQAWLKHGTVLDKQTSTAAARALAERFAGDTGAADWRHFGRCCAFTNRKPKRRDPETGRFPLVRLIEAEGEVYPASERFVAEILSALEEKQRERDTLRTAISVAREKGLPLKSIEAFRNDPRYGPVRHGADLAYSIYALAHGATEQEVEAAIRTRDLTHKGSEKRVDDYIARTINKARERTGPIHGR